MKKHQLLIFFLVINLGSLAIGIWLMNSGPTSEWYLALNKAPWTPPGWLFGVAWTTIMVCFSVYLSFLFENNTTRKVKIAFTLQVIFNVIWNFIFFNQHLVLLGLINIILLTVVVYYFFFSLKTKPKLIKLLLLPYMIWLVIATSLNAYILFNN